MLFRAENVGAAHYYCNGEDNGDHDGVEEERECGIMVGTEDFCRSLDYKGNDGDAYIIAGKEIGEVSGGFLRGGGDCRSFVVDDGLDYAVTETYDENTDDECPVGVDERNHEQSNDAQDDCNLHCEASADVNYISEGKT